MDLIKNLAEVKLSDIALVGGKTASIGQMIQSLSGQGIDIPMGFAITTNAYWYFLKSANILDNIVQELEKLPTNFTELDLNQLNEISSKIKNIISKSKFPEELTNEIFQAYKALSKYYNSNNISVAVRSSATAEDLPKASFAGQQDTFLNISGDQNLLEACKKCFASLFNERAIAYRIKNKFDHLKVALSICVQKMVRSDLASSGVMFTLDTESGFKDIVLINSSYGLGENIVKGVINPDEFQVFKPSLNLGYKPIIKKYLGTKQIKLVYTDTPANPTHDIAVSQTEQNQFSLSDGEILQLAIKAIIIENFYSELNNRWYPMDIEWAKDGQENKLYILQARPETIHINKLSKILKIYKLKSQTQPKTLLTGHAITKKITSGKVKILTNLKDAAKFNDGDILVTNFTEPNWVPLMKKAAAIITNQGGRTCHAAIVSRELGIPALVGTLNATEILKNNQEITLDCSQGALGFVYDGIINYDIIETDIEKLSKPEVDILLNISNPDRAFDLSFLPVNGVGLARLEFVVSNKIGVHPMAICQPEKIKDAEIQDLFNKLSLTYGSLKEFYIEVLSQAISTISAAFYPKPVMVRLTDFKTNEYNELIGGNFFEETESNPMIGFRGAARYCDPNFTQAFELECSAIKKVRDEMGLYNTKLLIPFVRTVEEAECTIEQLKKFKLFESKNKPEIYMMIETPANVLLLDQYKNYFAGFSIGSNDLSQLILGVDRDSAKLSTIFDERNEAVKTILNLAVEKAKKINKYISICGEAPSDFPEIAEMLIKKGIDAISLDPESIIPFLTK